MAANAKNDSILYHYTSTEGLKGIIESRALHCSNCLFLNDSKEYSFIVDLVKKHLETSPPEGLSKSQIGCLNRILSVAEYAFSNPDSITTPYITSFSTNGDLLSQWRGYCTNGGYSLGFSRDKLMQSANKKWVLSPVNYAQIEEIPSQLRV